MFHDHGSRSERGQVLPLVIAILAVLCLITGAVIDIGYAYHVKNELQASADAAALAGAGELPDPALAESTASAYGADKGGKNSLNGGESVSLDAVANCATGPKFCNPANTVRVTETTDVSTMFLRVIGIDSITETVHAQACSPCGEVPLDIMIVIDRSGSMGGQKLQDAKDGVASFLASMDPTVDNVGLAVFPPAASGDACATSTSSTYNQQNADYLLSRLSNSYATVVNGQTSLVPTSELMSDLNCIQAGGSTAYANALDAARAELELDGRSGVRPVIIMLSDGAANTGPSYLPTTSPYRTNPCATAVSIADDAKSAGVLMYTIAYDIAGSGSDPCYASDGSKESPGIQAVATLQQIASPGNYFAQPQPAQLSGIFLAISADLAHGTSRLNG